VVNEDDPEAIPGMVGTLHTFGSLMNFHPHCHALVADESSPDNLPYFADQCRPLERLRKEEGVGWKPALPEDIVFDIARREKDTKSRAALCRAGGEVGAGDSGHHDIRHEEIDSLRKSIEKTQRLLTVLGNQDSVSRAFEDSSGDLSDRALVLDQQDRPAPGRRNRSRNFDPIRLQLILDGRQMKKLVPQPGADSTLICPPLCVMIPWAMARPSPVPFPISFVVKNGSNILAMVSSSIPHPESVMTTRTIWPIGMCRVHAEQSGSHVQFSTLMVSVPPPGMASRALTAMFMMTCSICPGSIRTLASD
jgi:hypothetical protein